MSARPPLPLLVAAAVFVLVIAWLVIASLVPHNVQTFIPHVGPDTVTLDARSATEWRFFSFARGLLTAPDTAGWDLGMRRYHLIVAGTAAEIDTGSFETLTATPTAAYESTSYGRDTVNRAIARWYRYDMFSHLLHPKRAVYVVKNRDGSAYELEFLSYYCPGPDPGCVTFRYQLLQ
jgi:hypothetical protein